MPLLERAITLIIGECVTDERFTRFKLYAADQGIVFEQVLNVAAGHSGMSGAQIIHHLLDHHTILLTSNGALHNKVLSKSLKSYFVNDEHISDKFLPHINTLSANNKPNSVPVKSAPVPNKNNNSVQPAIRDSLLPTSSKDLKRLSKKCRRIRNYFDGLNNIDSVAVTVSLRAFDGAQLIGVKIRILSAADVEVVGIETVNVEAVNIEVLDASESYILEACEQDQAGLVALNYSLITVILLRLNSVKTVVFFDTDYIALPDKYDKNKINKNDHLALYFVLINTFEKLEFNPAHKGAYIEQLRLRIFDLISSDSNEIKLGNMADIIKSVFNGRL